MAGQRRRHQKLFVFTQTSDFKLRTTVTLTCWSLGWLGCAVVSESLNGEDTAGGGDTWPFLGHIFWHFKNKKSFDVSQVSKTRSYTCFVLILRKIEEFAVSATFQCKQRLRDCLLFDASAIFKTKSVTLAFRQNVKIWSSCPELEQVHRDLDHLMTSAWSREVKGIPIF